MELKKRERTRSPSIFFLSCCCRPLNVWDVSMFFRNACRRQRLPSRRKKRVTFLCGKTDMVAHSPNWIAFPTVVNDSRFHGERHDYQRGQHDCFIPTHLILNDSRNPLKNVSLRERDNQKIIPRLMITHNNNYRNLTTGFAKEVQT